jgi:glyoxylase-like metal-dependent hydrolase (beta-lactamase superfamily II)
MLEDKRGPCNRPCSDEDFIFQRITEKGLNLKYIENTHGHADHTGGNGRIRELTGRR